MLKIQHTVQICLVFALLQGVALAAGNITISYAGRLTKPTGEPFTGHRAMTVRFFADATGGAAIGPELEFPDVTLDQGLFSLPVELTPAQIDALFGDDLLPVFIEVEVGGTLLPRQAFNTVPAAARVPVDGKTVAFDNNGRLHVGPNSPAGAGEYLTSDGSGVLMWSTPSGSGGGGVVENQLNDGETTKAPSQNVVFDALVGKEPAQALGTGLQYWRGDKTWATLNSAAVPEVTNLYFTDARARTAAVVDSVAGAAVNIAPSQKAVADALATKEVAITAGTAAQYMAGNKTWQTLNTTAVPEGANLYFTNSRAQTALAGDLAAVSAALALKQDLSMKNAANGYAGLDGSGKILAANMPYSGLSYQGTWNASTNLSPALVSGACGTQGNYYVVSTGGATTLNGITPWSLGDWVICGGAGAWQRVGNSSGGVTTVNGLTGSTITMTTDNVDEGSANLYFTTGRARTAAVADAVVDTVANVAPSQNAVFDALAGKENSLSTGLSTQYYRGDKTWATISSTNVTEGTNLFFTDGRAQTAAVADTIADGTTTVAPSQNAVFDALATKLNASATIPITNGGTGATTQVGAANAILPSQTSQTGKYLTTNGTNVSWSSVAGGVAVGDALGGSTSGSVLFVNSGNIGQANSSLFWDNANSRLGVGTNTPAVKFQVSGGAMAGTYVTGASAAIDFSAGNIQSTTVAPASTLTFAAGTMVNGTAYTLILTNAGTGVYTLGTTGDITTWKCRPVCASNQVQKTAAKDTLLTIIRAGNVGYVTWLKDF